MEAIKITLETLYDILRNEKKREDLQKLDNSFYSDVVSYVREKNALLESKQKSNELFAAGERDKLEYELRSIKRILKEIYERRERKIIDISLNKSKTGSDIIDTSAMLTEEKEFYEKVVAILNTYRQGILLNLFEGRLPGIVAGFKGRAEDRTELAGGSTESTKAGIEPSKAEIEDKPASAPSTFTQFETAKPAERKQQEDKQQQDSEQQNTVMSRIRFVHPVPSFVWKDLKVYGPFEKGEETGIFPEVADLLVRKGRALKIA